MKVLLDTDIGSDIDDAICLAYLLAQPQCDLLGITTSSEPDLDGGDPSQQELISEEQIATLSALREEVKANGPKFLAWLGIASLGELPASRYKEAVTALETMRRKP